MTQHNRILAVVVTAVCLVSFALFAQAEVIVHESFTYTPGGDLNGQGPGDIGFTGTWSGSVDYDVASGSLSYPSSSPLSSSGNKATFSPISTGERISQTMSAAIDFDSDGAYYVSFLVNKTDGGTGGDYFWLQWEGSGSQKGAFGLSSAEQLMAQAGDGYSPGFGSAIPLNQDVLLVGKIITSASGDDQFMLIKFGPNDTVPVAEPASWGNAIDLAAVTGTTDTLVLRKGTSASMRIDEIRIGTTWSDVTHVPEPSTLLMCLSALVGLAWRRRRRARRITDACV